MRTSAITTRSPTAFGRNSVYAVLLVIPAAPIVYLALLFGPFYVEDTIYLFIDDGDCQAAECRYLASSLILVGRQYPLLVTSLFAGLTALSSYLALKTVFSLFPRADAKVVGIAHVATYPALMPLFIDSKFIPLLFLATVGALLVSLYFHLKYWPLKSCTPPTGPRDPLAGRDHAARPEGGAVLTIAPRFTPAIWKASLLYLGTITLLAAVFVHGYGDDHPILMISVSLFLGESLFLLFATVYPCLRGRPLAIGWDGLTYRGQAVPWTEIGRVWRGSGTFRSDVVLETPLETEKRVVMGRPWIDRWLETGQIDLKASLIGTNSVVLDTQYLDVDPADLVAIIEARRPPGTRWLSEPTG